MGALPEPAPLHRQLGGARAACEAPSAVRHDHDQGAPALEYAEAVFAGFARKGERLRGREGALGHLLALDRTGRGARK